MAARSTRVIHPWHRTCLAALALLAGCATESAPESASAPAAEPAAGAATRPEEDRGQLVPPEPGAEDVAPAAAPLAATPTPTPAPAPVATPMPAPPAATPGSTPAPPVATPTPGQALASTPEAAPRPGGKNGYAGRTRDKPRASQGQQRPSTRPAQAGDSAGARAADGPPVTAAELADRDRPAEEPAAPQNLERLFEEPSVEPPAQPAVEAAAPQASVEAFYASLPEQAIAFHVPRTVARGQLFTVRLVVQPGLSEADIERVLVDIVADAGPAPKPGELRTRTTRIGDDMQARISSPTLQIVARGEDRQLVRRDAPTEWTWDVTANAGGSHRLTLGLYAIPEGRGSGVKVKTFEETLTVEVTFFDEVKETVANHWEWMWTFVLGPLGALVWRWRQQRRARAGSPP